MYRDSPLRYSGQFTSSRSGRKDDSSPQRRPMFSYPNSYTDAVIRSPDRLNKNVTHDVWVRDLQAQYDDVTQNQPALIAIPPATLNVSQNSPQKSQVSPVRTARNNLFSDNVEGTGSPPMTSRRNYRVPRETQEWDENSSPIRRHTREFSDSPQSEARDSFREKGMRDVPIHTQTSKVEHAADIETDEEENGEDEDGYKVEQDDLVEPINSRTGFEAQTDDEEEFVDDNSSQATLASFDDSVDNEERHLRKQTRGTKRGHLRSSSAIRKKLTLTYRTIFYALRSLTLKDILTVVSVIFIVCASIVYIPEHGPASISWLREQMAGSSDSGAFPHIDSSALREVNQRLSRVEQQSAAERTLWEKFDAKFDASFDSIQETMANMNRRFDQVEVLVSQNAQDIAILKEEGLSGVAQGEWANADEVISLKDEITATTNRLDSIDAKLEHFDEKISRLDESNTSKLSQLENKLATNTEKLQRYGSQSHGEKSSDVNGANFADSNIGAKILRPLTSPTYDPLRSMTFAYKWIRNKFAPPSYVNEHRPETVLTPNMDIGRCWPMTGSHGTVAVEFDRTVDLHALGIVHPEKFRLTDATSAPRQGSFYVAPINLDDANKLRAMFVESNSHPGYFQVTKFEYDINSLESVQAFDLPHAYREIHPQIKSVIYEIDSNWGNRNYTCIYRVAAYGKLWHQNDDFADDDVF